MSEVRQWRISLVLSLILFVIPVRGLYSPGCQSNNSDSLCGWKNAHFNNGCQWKIDKDKNRVSFILQEPKGGSAFLTKDFLRSRDDPLQAQICVKFTNFVRHQSGSDGNQFEVIINAFGHQVDSAIQDFSYCHNSDETETNFTISLKVQCDGLSGRNNYISDLQVTIEQGWSTTESVRTTGDDMPTEIGDIQYVGVVVGAICIALFTLFSCLTIISARRSNQRDSRRREVASGSCHEEEDDHRDVVAENAPPSYDAVMACPDMYPPTPQGTPHGTPESTPYLSIHRRALLNQHANSLPASPQSQRDSFAPNVTEEWDEEREDPPPPYPGLANGDITRTTDNDDTGESTLGESNPRLNTPGNEPRSSEHDELAVDDQDSNPWVLNIAQVNTSADVNPRAGLTTVRGNTSDDGHEEIALRARTTEPESSDVSPDDDEDNQRASTLNNTDTIVGVDIHESARNSLDDRPKSDINHEGSAFAAVTIV